MHSHGNPNLQVREISRRKAALQIEAGSTEDLADAGPSEAAKRMLYRICSI
jgi:hypothetical protein